MSCGWSCVSYACWCVLVCVLCVLVRVVVCVVVCGVVFVVVWHAENPRVCIQNVPVCTGNMPRRGGGRGREVSLSPERFTESNHWMLPISSLRIRREQHVPDSSNHSQNLIKLFKSSSPEGNFGECATSTNTHTQHTHTHNHNTQQHSTPHHTNTYNTETEREKEEEDWERRDKTRQDTTRQDSWLRLQESHGFSCRLSALVLNFSPL